MAGIQVSGMGSGLDINGLVSQLVSAEGAPRMQSIMRREAKLTTQLSALGSLKGALGAFKSALEPLKTLDVFRTRKATSSDSDILSITADSKATAGQYQVQVLGLARAHQLSSAAFTDGSGSTVGHGTLTLTVNGESFSVTIDPQAATLANIRDAINQSSDNVGVQATILNGSGGARLVLTSSATGADHAISVAASGGDGGLDQLAYDPDGVMNLTEIAAAENAKITIAGFAVESSTNTFTNAIDGVTIVAKKPTQPDASVDIGVAFDSSAVTSRISKFVTEYNNMRSQLAKLGSYNAETKAAGPLLGDSLLRAIESEMRRGISDPVASVTGDYTTLASIGIKTTASGALEIDTADLRAALEAEPESIAKLFGAEDGIAARLHARLEERLASEGDVESRAERLNTGLKDITKDKEALNVRMAQVEARYRRQFIALDGLLSQMQSTSSYLAQQLANLPKIGK